MGPTIGPAMGSAVGPTGGPTVGLMMGPMMGSAGGPPGAPMVKPAERPSPVACPGTHHWTCCGTWQAQGIEGQRVGDPEMGEGNKNQEAQRTWEVKKVWEAQWHLPQHCVANILVNKSKFNHIDEVGLIKK